MQGVSATFLFICLANNLMALIINAFEKIVKKEQNCGNNMEKEENAGNQHFLPFPQFFLSFTISSFNPFLRVCYTNLLKTLWEKEKLLITSNLSFSHSVLYPFRELFAIFIKFIIVVCKLFQFGKV